jgi:hypothetical protein
VDLRQQVYLIGSLREPRVPIVAGALRAEGIRVFDDWYAAGRKADDEWMEYEKNKGHNFAQALQGEAAKNVFAFDKRHIEASQAVVLALPAGKSGHLELGWALGKDKLGYILLNGEPDRFDVMYQFADGVFTDIAALAQELKRKGF